MAKRKVHPLKLWLVTNGYKNREFANITEINEGHLSNFICSRQWPVYRVAKKISEATKGEVDVGTLMTWGRE